MSKRLLRPNSRAAMPTYPDCGSRRTVKNGCVHNGKQRFLCHDCNRLCETAALKAIAQATPALIDCCFPRIYLTGIVRVIQVSERWLQSYVTKEYVMVSRQVRVQLKKREIKSSVGSFVVICRQ